MTSVLTFVEHDGGTPEKVSLEALTFARALSERMSLPLYALVIGADGAVASDALGAYGVAEVHVATDDRLDPYAPRAWAASAATLMDAGAPAVVVGPGSERGAEVMAHLAARAGLPLAANCTHVEPGDPFVVTRQRWGGSLLEVAELEAPVALLTVAPHAVQPEPATGPGAASCREFRPTLDEADLIVRVAGRLEPERGAVSLSEARVVVGGGRGVGSADGFAELEELAELLGGTVGVSRVVTSLGWRPHTDQVGQTGTRIAPDLYVACGISGAIQHMVGAKGAKHLLAINTDREAPIMAKAEWAVVGDLHAVVSAVNAEIRRVRGS
ncbi:MAG TPA: electron transfer flavoprotein subunit alpha/FixB family protein [Actinomycetota bacterium]